MKTANRETYLVDFSVTNYRSIRETVTMSMVATGKSRINTFYCEALGEHLLRSAVIYGANASGKSTLIRGLHTIVNALTGSISLFHKDRQMREPEPFLFDDTSKDQPTTFTISLVNNRTYFHYEIDISAKDKSITREVLDIKYPDATSSSTIFVRTNDSARLKNYIPVSRHGISQKYLNAVDRATPITTTISRLETAKPTVAHEFVEALRMCVTINSDAHNRLDYLINILDHEATEDETNAKTSIKHIILEFLSSADISIIDLEVQVNSEGNKQLYAIHQFISKDKAPHFIKLPLYEESTGTRQLLQLIAPMMQSLVLGHPFIVDELDSAIHPLLLRFIIAKFHSPKWSNAPQLIITSHDATLMDDRQLLSTDQIFFVEKRSDQTSDLYSLADFKEIRNETRNLSKRYLNGEFGANPFISRQEA